MKRFVSIASARPNFVKLAAVHHAIAQHRPTVEHVIIHTGQHYDPLFSDVFFEQLEIVNPTANLGVSGGTREEQIERVHRELTQVLPRLQPDVILVYGDVNGAVGAARAAVEVGVPIAHVEAGLRSFDLSMPEEWNRMEVDRLATYLFCTEESGMEHLREEGVTGRAELVGNTMIDTLLHMLPEVNGMTCPVEDLSPFAVVTLHRPSNVDTPEALAHSIDFLNAVADVLPIVLPAHHRLRLRLSEFGLTDRLSPHIRLIDPLGYLPFLRLVQDAAFILTDSGGIQEEAVVLQKRCFTLRRNTERPVTIQSGSNVLVDLDNPADRDAVLSFARQPSQPQVRVPELWDGKAGERIYRCLMASLSA